MATHIALRKESDQWIIVVEPNPTEADEAIGYYLFEQGWWAEDEDIEMVVWEGSPPDRIQDAIDEEAVRYDPPVESL